MTVFISHAPADRNAAEALEKVIERRGQFAELDDGQTALRPVQGGDVLVLLVSQALTFATARLRLEQRALDAWAEGRLIIVKLDHGFPPVGLRDLPAIDASFEAQREFKWLEVADAIREKLRAPLRPSEGGETDGKTSLPPAGPIRKRQPLVALTAFAVFGVGVSFATGLNMQFFSKGVGLIQGASTALMVAGVNGLLGICFGLAVLALRSHTRALPKVLVSVAVVCVGVSVLTLNLWFAHAREVNLLSPEGGLNPRAALDRLLSNPLDISNSLLLLLLGMAVAVVASWCVLTFVRALFQGAHRTGVSRKGNRSRSQIDASTSDAVFVSYASANRSVVLPVINAVKQLGKRFWVDQQGIAAGEGWAGEIVRAIKASPRVVVMCSQAAFESDHVKREIYLADRYRKQLLPVFIEQAEPPEDFEYFFAGVQMLKLFETPEAERPQALAQALGTAT